MIRSSICKDYIFQATAIESMKRNIEKVQLNDIIKKAGVSKTTFYRYFSNKNDVINQYIKYIMQLVVKKETERLTWHRFLHFFLQKNENLLLLKTLLSTGYKEIKQRCLSIDYTILSTMLRRNGVRIEHTKNQLILKVYIVVLLELYCEWIRKDTFLRTEELVKLLEFITPPQFRFYFECSDIRPYISEAVI